VGSRDGDTEIERGCERDGDTEIEKSEIWLTQTKQLTQRGLSL
jgi:hypothetical protein